MRFLLNRKLRDSEYSKTFLLIGCSLALLFVTQHLLAQSPSDVAGAFDHRAVERFPDSRIVQYESTQERNHQLLLGSMRRVGGRVVPERVERLQGTVTRITYEIPDTFRGSDVFDYFLEQLQQRDYSELFSCAGRDCGNSSYWANNAFNNRILNGSERNQFYMVMEAPLIDSDRSFVSVYVITRANRRIYAYVEILDEIYRGDGAREVDEGGIEAGSEDEIDGGNTHLSLSEQLQQTGSAVVAGLRFDDKDVLIDDTGLVDIVELLRADDSLRVHIVGHVREDGEIERLLERSLSRAEQVYQRLIAAGINPVRITAQGVGPLAPLCIEQSCDQRIELVLQ